MATTQQLAANGPILRRWIVRTGLSLALADPEMAGGTHIGALTLLRYQPFFI